MIIVFEIGGTKTRIASSLDAKTVEDVRAFPTLKNFEEAMANFAEIAKIYSKKEKIVAAAGGVAGPLDSLHSSLSHAPHLKDWIGKPLHSELENVFNAPVLIENDAAVGAIGEAVLGAGSGENIVAYVAIGTGVGGARVVGGRIDDNSFGFEIGHQIIEREGRLCGGCGGLGHLEAYISGSAIEERFSLLPEKITDSAIWDEVADILAIGLANVSLYWSPDIIIIGGSVGLSDKLRFGRVEENLSKALPIFKSVPRVVRASLGDSSGLIGSMLLIRHAL